MQGIIVLWSGAIVDIPAGWALCDGNNGTPDLRDKFVIGAGDTYGPDDSGGVTTHFHSFTGDGHDHTLLVGTNVGFGPNLSLSTDEESATGDTDGENHLPPYYALAFIMKL